MTIHVLLNNIYYRKQHVVEKGYVFFNNEVIVDLGEEPKPEYDLAELLYDYEYRAYVVHGFSVASGLSNYLFRGLEGFDPASFSDNELEKFIEAGFYELYMNGITLPIVIDAKPELVNKVVKENEYKAVIMHERGVLKQYSGITYIEVDNGILYYMDRRIGLIENIICRLNEIHDDCHILDISDQPSFNISVIIHYLRQKLGDIQKTLEILCKPYSLLGFDNGFVDKGSKPDLLVFDLKHSYKSTPISRLDNVLLRGYTPDIVFINADIYFDHGESLVITPLVIDKYLVEK